MGIARFRRITLRGKKDFDRLFACGAYTRSSGVSLLCSQESSPEEPTRIAICVSRRMCNAVTRNRLRRVTRESLEPLLDDMRPGWLVGVFPTLKFKDLNQMERKKAISKALQKAGLLR